MPTHHPTVLYVDDDPMSRDVLKILFQKVMGITDLFLLPNSENFMAQVQALPQLPEVIFLDIQVRPFNGYEMLAMLRQDPAYAHQPIIALTANVMANDVERMKNAGFSGLIAKPITNRIFPLLFKKILAGEPVWYIS
ncbi:MAG: response regulator [Chloroflexi bacterium]|nr:response regulator [Chloroflexota bacterium]